MAISASIMAERESRLRSPSGEVHIFVDADVVNGLLLPCHGGKYQLQAVMREMTYGDSTMIERACSETFDPHGFNSRTEVDINEVKRLTIKRCLMEWNLDIPLYHRNGWLTEDCYRRVSRVSAPLLDAMMREYDNLNTLTEDEEERIERQCAVLFAKNSQGVYDACEAVSLFCTLGNFNEKFGMTEKDVMDMSYRHYLMIKMVLGKEGIATRANAPKPKPAGRPSNIVIPDR